MAPRHVSNIPTIRPPETGTALRTYTSSSRSYDSAQRVAELPTKVAKTDSVELPNVLDDQLKEIREMIGNLTVVQKKTDIEGEQEVIHFKDAVGRKFNFPWEKSNNWNVSNGPTSYKPLRSLIVAYTDIAHLGH